MQKSSISKKYKSYEIINRKSHAIPNDLAKQPLILLKHKSHRQKTDKPRKRRNKILLFTIIKSKISNKKVVVTQINNK